MSRYLGLFPGIHAKPNRSIRPNRGEGGGYGPIGPNGTGMYAAPQPTMGHTRPGVRLSGGVRQPCLIGNGAICQNLRTLQDTALGGGAKCP